MNPKPALVLAAFLISHTSFSAQPNILFIAIDDQNDWIGHLGGHPMAKTPNLDKLAARGTTFSNAHCNAPLCNPSRTSLMLGLRPTTTGVYGLAPWFRTVPDLRDRVTLPQYFASQGYRTAATGKIYHLGTGGGRKAKTGGAPEFQVTAPLGGPGTLPPHKLIPPTPMGDHPLMDWGGWPLDNDDTGKGDYKVATWTIGQIKDAPKDQPFFIAAGFSLPHVPLYATKKWFDLYPDDDTVLPKILENDRDGNGLRKTTNGAISSAVISPAPVSSIRRSAVYSPPSMRRASPTTRSSCSGGITAIILVKKASRVKTPYGTAAPGSRSSSPALASRAGSAAPGPPN
jgi:hypothetical protein